jgi:hypothetical protein
MDGLQSGKAVLRTTSISLSEASTVAASDCLCLLKFPVRKRLDIPRAIVSLCLVSALEVLKGSQGNEPLGHIITQRQGPSKDTLPASQ